MNQMKDTQNEHLRCNCVKQPQEQNHINDINQNTSCDNSKRANKKGGGKCKFFLKGFLVLLSLLYATNYYFKHLQNDRCYLKMPRSLRNVFRPPVDCKFCRNVNEILRLNNLSSVDFDKKYAYTGQPIIVEDATQNWTALTKFDYWYFRDVYRNAVGKRDILKCQFLPYKTGFNDIFEALDMDEDRVALKPGTEPWYFGWSNCHSASAEEFLKHYTKPYFFPKLTDNRGIEWFFIGTEGMGAHMHVDNVYYPSWQAQLSGSKRWLLEPPPECYFVCKEFEVIVKKGDMIVLDTNKWYHQTFVQPGEVSLTLGAEYD